MSTRAAAAPPVPPRPADYGIDAPKRVRQLFTRGAVLVLLGAGIWFMNRASAPGPGFALFCVLACIGLGFLAAAAIMRWSSKVGKLRVRDTILDSLPWRGDERVLDAGCGRGLFAVGAAKRISKPAKATGVDIWDSADLAGNSADAAMANAKAEGVADRVKIDTGDLRKLPYGAATFDTVLSSVAIHNLDEAGDRDTAVREMWRVLKPGGHLAILDIAHTGEYLNVLKSAGAELVRESGFTMLWAIPTTRWFIVRKPAI
jgi:SAM-dependent methyltransferase